MTAPVQGKPVVLIAEELSPATVEALGPDFEIRHCNGADRAELLPAIAEADAILVRSATKVDAEALAAAQRLTVVARAGVGLDNVDVDDRGEELVAVRAVAVADLEVRAQRVDGRGAQLFGDQDDGLGHVTFLTEVVRMVFGRRPRSGWVVRGRPCTTLCPVADSTPRPRSDRAVAGGGTMAP